VESRCGDRPLFSVLRVLLMFLGGAVRYLADGADGGWRAKWVIQSPMREQPLGAWVGQLGSEQRENFEVAPPVNGECPWLL
jgi:hypothetical protein